MSTPTRRHCCNLPITIDPDDSRCAKLTDIICNQRLLDLKILLSCFGSYLKPSLTMLQSLHCAAGARHRAVPPPAPREQVNVVQWNLRSSLPSATHRGFFLPSPLLALSLMLSLYCSNLHTVLSLFWTLSILSILHMGACFLSQLDWKMISTMFLLVSSGPSSETAIDHGEMFKS
jgi:hypothetical protein